MTPIIGSLTTIKSSIAGQHLFTSGRVSRRNLGPGRSSTTGTREAFGITRATSGSRRAVFAVRGANIRLWVCPAFSFFFLRFAFLADSDLPIQLRFMAGYGRRALLLASSSSLSASLLASSSKDL